MSKKENKRKIMSGENNNPLTIFCPFEEYCSLCNGNGKFTKKDHDNCITIKHRYNSMSVRNMDKYDFQIDSSNTKLLDILNFQIMFNKKFPIKCPNCKGRGKVVTAIGLAAKKWLKR